MTTIRNNAVNAPANQTLPTLNDSAGQSSPGATPFSTLLQQHASIDQVAVNTAVNAAPRATPPAPQHTPDAEPPAHAPEKSASHEAAQDAQSTAQNDASQPADGSSGNQVDNSKASGKSPPSKAVGKSTDKGKAAQTDPAGTAKTAAAQADKADGQSAAAAGDPLAAWLAALHGGAVAPAATASATADAGAQTAKGALTLTSTRAQGDSLMQAAGGGEPALPGAAGHTLKAGDAAGFAAALAGQGRSGDAAGGNALGLAAVRMLGTDASASNALGTDRQTASAGSLAPDASAQSAALSALTGVAAAPVHGLDAPTVAAPVGSAGFANDLADQVQVLVSKAALDAAAGSVHEARLNLNPAEMGPISIRIALEGNQAHVDFAAASGATRQALHDSMPALASALHGAGLTLSGGGVSQQFAQAQQGQAQQPGANGSRSSGGRMPDRDDGTGGVQDITSTVANWVRQPEGRLDLYA